MPKSDVNTHADVRSIFPYFGAKSKIAHLYPEPVYKTIIEPFAGGASYSLYYATQIKASNVWLNDLNPPTVAVWRFLTSKDALKIVHERIPFTVKAGTTIDELTKPSDPEGLVWLMRSQFAQASFGMKGVRNKVAPFGALAWEGFRNRLEWWIPRIEGWKITMMDYRDLPNQKATWFVDPPYNNAAGKTYAKGASGIDYVHLAGWCKERIGQTIVCENYGANWLPFEWLEKDHYAQGKENKRRGIYTEKVQSTTGEVMWTQNTEENYGLFAD